MFCIISNNIYKKAQLILTITYNTYPSRVIHNGLLNLNVKNFVKNFLNTKLKKKKQVNFYSISYLQHLQKIKINFQQRTNGVKIIFLNLT